MLGSFFPNIALWPDGEDGDKMTDSWPCPNLQRLPSVGRAMGFIKDDRDPPRYAYSFCSLRRKATVMVVMTSTGSPFKRVGW